MESRFKTNTQPTHRTKMRTANLQMLNLKKDPTLGKLEILKLREDVMKKEDAAFSLEQFHNNFMKQGFPPIKIVAGPCWEIIRPRSEQSREGFQILKVTRRTRNSS